MDVSQQTLLILSALGALNGLLLSVYLILTAKQKVPYILLGLLLLVISIRVGKSVLFYFNPNIEKLILQIGLTACLFIGPILFLYVRRSKHANYPNQKISFHLSLVAILSIVLGVLYPYSSYPALWSNEVYKAINYIWAGYILMCLPMVWQTLSETRKSNKVMHFDDFLMLNVFIGVTLIWASYFTASYTSYIAGALSFSFSFYISILFSIHYYQKLKTIKYLDSQLTETQLALIESGLKQQFQQQQVFLNANLTLTQLAKKLSVSKTQLSQYLNQQLSKSFNQFVNQYRVKYAAQQLTQFPNTSIDVIAEQSGFNSNSTFYSAFKSQFGVTPNQYRNIDHKSQKQQ